MIQLASLLAIPRISKQEFSLFLRHEFRGYPNHLEELENKCLPDREFSKCITRASRVEENSKRELSEKFCWPTNKWRGSKIKRRSVCRVACVIDLPSPSSVFIALQAFFARSNQLHTISRFVNFLADLKRFHAQINV